MERRFAVPIRCLMAALMLLTGVLGQAGHAWAHGAAADAGAWAAAMRAEAAWLSHDPGSQAGSDIQVFGGARHDGHDRTPHHHDGPDGHAGDHAHGVAFLAPHAPALGVALGSGALGWSVSPGLPTHGSGGPERPPRAG